MTTENRKLDIAAMPRQAVQVLTSPAAFFQGMPKSGGFMEPSVFLLFMAILSTVIHFVRGFLAYGAMGLGTVVWTMMLIPVFVIAAAFVGAAVLFVIWKLMGSQETYETAFRCGAYISVLSPIAALLGFVPYLGSAVGMALQMFFVVAASVEVHKIARPKAWLVFGTLGCLLILAGIWSENTAHRAAQMRKMQLQQMDASSRQMQEAVMKMQAELMKNSQGKEMTPEQRQQMQALMQQLQQGTPSRTQ
ncbi:MAG: YIP1 family protein [Elusimicrobiota bacterium]